MSSFYCDGSFCQPCGGTDQRCCLDDLAGTPPCAVSADNCVMGFCRSGCGGAGEPCCMLRRCAAGLWCNTSNTCM
jgi:hypothetical protein